MGKKERERKARQDAEAAATAEQSLPSGSDVPKQKWIEAEGIRIRDAVAGWLKEGDGLAARGENPNYESPTWLDFLERKLQMGRDHLQYLIDIRTLKEHNIKTRKQERALVRDYSALEVAEMITAIDERRELTYLFDYLFDTLSFEMKEREQQTKEEMSCEPANTALATYADAIFERIWHRNCGGIQRISGFPFFEVKRDRKRHARDIETAKALVKVLHLMMLRIAPAGLFEDYLESVSRHPPAGSSNEDFKLRQPISTSQIRRIQLMQEAILRYEEMCTRLEGRLNCPVNKEVITVHKDTMKKLVRVYETSETADELVHGRIIEIPTVDENGDPDTQIVKVHQDIGPVEFVGIPDFGDIEEEEEEEDKDEGEEEGDDEEEEEDDIQFLNETMEGMLVPVPPYQRM